MAVEGSGGPRVNPPSTNHLHGNLEDDGGDVSLGKEVLAVLPGLRGEAVLLGQGRVEGAECHGVSGKEIRGHPGKDRDILGAHDAARLSRRKDGALGPFASVGADRSANLEMLDVPVLVPAGVFNRAETNLECKLFLGVAVQVETEGVKSLIAERIGSGENSVGVHRHGHDCVSGRAPEEIKVADIDPRINVCDQIGRAHV